jgi:hypothetical protein
MKTTILFKSLLLGVLFLINFESFSQIKKFKQESNLTYISLDLGYFEQFIEQSTYVGVSYGSKLIGNLGLEGGIGFYSANEDYLKFKKDGKVPSNYSSPFAGTFASGFSSRLSINYVIPIKNGVWGIIPKFGISATSMSSLNFYRNQNTTEGNIYTSTNYNPIVGLDSFIKRFVIGATYNISWNAANLSVGYVINNKNKEQ